MQSAALRAAGIPLSYARFCIRPNELAETLTLTRAREFVGVNITLPHKVATIGLMDYVDETARAIGAINTVQFRHGKLRGFNTDAAGFTKAIRDEFGVDARELRVLILGAGGVARAIAFACEKPRVWSRREQTDLRVLAHEADLIVNATPVGLADEEPPLLTRREFRPGQFVFDTIYRRTALLDEAAAAGAHAANGLSMLLCQGAAAFEIWFNRPAPVGAMRRALLL